MPLVATGDLGADAHRAGSAVLAFNVITVEHAEAVVSAAEATRRGVIVQVSENTVRYRRRLEPLAAATCALASGSSASVSLHLDHVQDFDLLRRAADCGFSSVMFDAGSLPYPENVERSLAAAQWAHTRGLWIEAELGYVGGKPHAPANAHTPGVRTDPVEAAEYVRATGVDALAVAVLHGSSGVADDELRLAIEAGMTKINIGTALNVEFSAGVRETLGPSADPRPYLARGRERVQERVARLLSAHVGPHAHTTVT